jgi:hypothetical protein
MKMACELFTKSIRVVKLELNQKGICLAKQRIKSAKESAADVCKSSAPKPTSINLNMNTIGNPPRRYGDGEGNIFNGRIWLKILM